MNTMLPHIVAFGDTLGAAVRPAVGEEVGPAVGEDVGPAVGVKVGPAVGEKVGPAVGGIVGIVFSDGIEGESDGEDVGNALGRRVVVSMKLQIVSAICIATAEMSATAE